MSSIKHLIEIKLIFIKQIFWYNYWKITNESKLKMNYLTKITFLLVYEFIIVIKNQFLIKINKMIKKTNQMFNKITN